MNSELKAHRESEIGAWHGEDAAEVLLNHYMLLSGETCIDGESAVVTPATKACLNNVWNKLAKANSGDAGVSRGVRIINRFWHVQ